MDRIAQIWRECLSAFDIESTTMLHQSTLDPFRRIYVSNGCIYKVVALQHEITSNLRAQNLGGEFSILKHCADIRGIPSPIAHHKTDEFEVLVMKRLPGERFTNLTVGWFRLFIILAKLAIILLRLSWRGISHNDIKSDNILITSDNSVSLVDFDQATRTKFLVAFIRQFTGINIGGGQVCDSLVTTFKKCVRKKLSPRTVQFLRRLLRRNDNEAMQTLPILPDNASSKLKTLLKAWQLAQLSDASSPGRQVAYYSLDVEGYHLPGERVWVDRWNILRSITDYSGKRILELGCNMCLLSTYLLKDSNVQEALAVDIDAKILEAAKLINMAFGVKLVLKVQNFDSPEDWETKLADFKPDIVFALNVLNWVDDKKRLLNFLGYFPEVIFEGHDNFDIESKRLSDVGFSQIAVIATSERGRYILHCRK